MNDQPSTSGPPPLPNADARADRVRWRICFWLIFLLTPVATVLFGQSGAWFRNALPEALVRVIGSDVVQSAGMMLTPILGALGAGFCLTRLHARPKTTFGLVACTIAFGTGLFIVYLGMAFVGCIFALSKSGI